MINSTKQRFLFAIDGIVNDTLGSHSLGKGHFMIADALKANAGGLKPIVNFSAVRKDEKRFKILVGEDAKAKNARSFAHGASESEVFSLSQIKSIKVKTPKNLQAEVDEWVVGWTGRQDEAHTSLKFQKNSRPFRLFMEIKGGQVPFSGGGRDTEIIDFEYSIDDSSLFNPCQEADKCDPVSCGAVVEDIVARLKRRRTAGGRFLTDYVDIYPIISCKESTSTDTLTYYTIDVCDTGDQNALSKIQGAYPDLAIKRLTRKGAITTYQTLAETQPSSYSSTTVEVIPTCDTCPAGWETINGGYIYVLTVVDEGTDISSDLAALISDYTTVTYIGAESGTGVGVYSVISEGAISDEIVENVVTDYPSATLSYLGEKDTVCSNETSVSIAWVEGDTCEVSQETYSIVLQDTECGQTRLEELQNAYPDLVISIDGMTSSAVSLIGSSGTANINVAEVDYLATFDTDIETTIANFIEAHGEALEELGFTVSANSNVITIVSSGNVTITNLTGDLTGGVENTLIPSTEACSTRYNAVVKTNMVCEECDPIFEDFFLSEKPEMYDGEQWTLVERATNVADDTECLCGIRIKAKPFKMEPDSRYFYKYPYIETSPEIQVSAGFQDYEDLETMQRPEMVEASVKQTHFKKDRDMLVGDLLPEVRHANMYSHGLTTGFGSMKDDFLGMSLPFNNLGAQVVQYSIAIDHDREQQGFRSRDGVTRNINIFVEYGKHADIEAQLNLLASAAGKQIVSA